MSWGPVLHEAKMLAIRQFVAGIVKERYPVHEDLLQRVCHALVTDGDAQAFAALLRDFHHAGYAQAVDDYRGQLAAMGLTVDIRHPEKLG